MVVGEAQSLVVGDFCLFDHIMLHQKAESFNRPQKLMQMKMECNAVFKVYCQSPTHR